MKTRNIGLTLKSVFLPDGNAAAFEQLLEEFFAARRALADRVLDVDLYSQIVFSTLEAHPQNKGVFLRAYIIENQGIGMISLAGAPQAADLLEMLPPEGHKFLKQEILLYVVRNRVVSFGMGRNNTQFSRLMTAALNDHGSLVGSLRIEDVPKRTTLEELKKVGVKRIDLSVTDYMESLPSARDMPPVLRAIFASPLSQDEALKRAKAVGRLTLSRGRTSKKEDFVRDEFLTRVGERVFENEADEDFTIVLENNRVITAKNFKVTRTYSVPAFANSVSYSHAKEALMAFARELDEQGLL